MRGAKGWRQAYEARAWLALARSCCVVCKVDVRVCDSRVWLWIEDSNSLFCFSSSRFLMSNASSLSRRDEISSLVFLM